jgi:ABC-type Mn2+/Zn2+ transport system permease subunit
VWGGLALSYYVPSLPPSSAIIVLAAAVYALVALRAWRRPARRLHQSM